MPRDGACQHDALDVAAEATEVFGILSVIDAQDVLLDDRASVQLLGDVMGRGPDEFDTTIVRRLVRIGAHECRQKPVMNVDDLRRVALQKLRTEDLHIPGENNSIDPIVLEEAEFFEFSLGLRGGGDRNVEEWDALAL